MWLGLTTLDKDKHNQLIEAIDDLVDDFKYKGSKYEDISEWVSKKKFSENLNDSRGKYGFDLGLKDIRNLELIDDEKDLFFLNKKKLSKITKYLNKWYKKELKTKNSLKMGNVNLLHYEEVNLPRGLHRDSKRKRHLKLFIPLAFKNKSSICQFQYVLESRLTIKSFLKRFFKKIFFRNKYFQEVNKTIRINPIPGNYFIGDQTMLHSDFVNNGSINRSMLTITFL